MIGSKQRMPKRARYPLFLLGLAIILLVGVAANSEGASPYAEAGVVAAGFVCLLLSVIVR
jgi:peptidoglycan/LPS O-acetylase OafA/YrhL